MIKKFVKKLKLKDVCELGALLSMTLAIDLVSAKVFACTQIISKSAKSHNTSSFKHWMALNIYMLNMLFAGSEHHSQELLCI